MARFVFSADGHLREPNDLFLSNLPPSMHKLTLRVEKHPEHMVTLCGDKVLYRLRLTPPRKDLKDPARPHLKGNTDLSARLEDLKAQGIDAEIMFPSVGMMTFLLETAEVEHAATQAYNDFVFKFVEGRRDVFVGCAILPLRDNFRHTVQEMKRIAAMGHTCAMIPARNPQGIPAYNDPAWDVVFEAAQALNIVLVVHSFTGREDVKIERGPGGAIYNYTNQITDAIDCTTRMVGGGVLDRFPRTQVAFIECGAGWLAGVAERMDESYINQDCYVSPKLSIMPSEIIRRQISSSFQRDRTCILSREITGHRALMWGADYPHIEGTYPHSRDVVEHMFDGIEIGEQEKADIIGGNAARLFRLERPEFARAA